MLALSPSPPQFSTIGWPLENEEPISHNHQNNYFYKDTETSDQYSFPHQSSSPQSQVEVERPSPQSTEPTMVKKVNHNASERDRRKKINTLYSSLRSLVPVADQMKKMSIPVTVSRVLNYIPELQQEVEGLIKKKEELLLRISRQGDDAVNKESQKKIKMIALQNSVFVVSTGRLNDSEASIQISSCDVHKTLLSEILLCLENNGFVLLNASSSVTSGGRVFYNLHFQVEENHRIESEVVSEKLLSIYEKKEGIFQSDYLC